MYAKAKVGGFLHLCIGEEATIVGATQALRENDYLMSTYREHGQALARGTPPERGDGRAVRPRGRLLRRPRRLDAPVRLGAALPRRLRDRRRQPAAGGRRRRWRPTTRRPRTSCSRMIGDGATNQGTFGETMNLAALWSLPVVFLVINNQFGMGTALERHSAVTDLSRKSDGFGVPGSQLRRHGRARHPRGASSEALEVRARGAQAAARRGGDLPLPRPLDGRPRGVPLQGGGRGVARARPDQQLPQAGDRGRA